MTTYRTNRWHGDHYEEIDFEYGNCCSKALDSPLYKKGKDSMNTNTGPEERIDVDYTQWRHQKTENKHLKILAGFLSFFMILGASMSSSLDKDNRHLRELVNQKTIVKTLIQYKDKIVYKDRVIEKTLPIPNLDPDKVMKARSLYKEIQWNDSVYGNAATVKELYTDLMSLPLEVRVQAYSEIKDQLPNIHK